MNIQNLDLHVIRFFQRHWVQAARFSIAVIFIWFGALKVLGLSPASALVQNLYDSSTLMTQYILSFDNFYTFFAWFEVLIGILFIFPRMTRIVMPLLAIHMITTFGPLVLLPTESWSGFMVPTLVGQYIIKNLVIIAAAMGIAAHLHPIEIRK